MSNAFRDRGRGREEKSDSEWKYEGEEIEAGKRERERERERERLIGCTWAFNKSQIEYGGERVSACVRACVRAG